MKFAQQIIKSWKRIGSKNYEIMDIIRMKYVIKYETYKGPIHYREATFSY